MNESEFVVVENKIFNKVDVKSGNRFPRSHLIDGKSDSIENLKNGFLDFMAPDKCSFAYNSFESEDLVVVTRADVSKNNVVDLRRIAEGSDTRTTLMLRNIPNKVDQQMLKEYVDVTNKNTYDFLCMI